MGGLSIGQFLVLLALVALAIKALAKPDVARKLFVIVAVGSAGPLAFVATNLVGKHLAGRQSAPNSDTTNADITDLSGEADANAGPHVEPPKPSDPQLSSNGKKKYNYLKQQALYDVPACQFPDDYGKYQNLISAGRSDLAFQLQDCYVIPHGTEVVQVDTIGKKMKQVILETDSQTLQLWSGYDLFKNALTRAQDEACKSGDQPCRDEIAAQFEPE
ncbi:hypothetical protein [Mesorhizobium sangaii]|uniref:Uncharacterized protein n=1 Tax=Mesorhizobium sangaii TaxID=505389 RepID=A0A841PDM5_9HYPH|nr:hypothetical protein [Mesorhizobium sangaii]MBB6411851.1 hypothetical protein [Mesorhizobium sangaii]